MSQEGASGVGLAAATAALALLAAAPIRAAPAADMPLGRPAAPPLGFLDYCVRNPGDCGVDPKGPDPVKEVRRLYWTSAFAARGATKPAVPPARPPALAWLPETRALVERINRQVNQAIVQQSDMATYGVKDYWAIPTLKGKDRYGDCEDYVLMKRRDLVAAGLPPEAMFIALARTREGGEHAVLIVATDQGELVLDSLTPWIVPWNKAPYRWLQRQRPGGPFDWSDPAMEAVAQGIKAGGG